MSDIITDKNFGRIDLWMWHPPGDQVDLREVKELTYGVFEGFQWTLDDGRKGSLKIGMRILGDFIPWTPGAGFVKALMEAHQTARHAVGKLEEEPPGGVCEIPPEHDCAV